MATEIMDTRKSGKFSFPELIALRYDLVTDIYRQRARALEVMASKYSLEYWLYKVLGPNLMGSIALTIDPYWQFVRPDKKLATGQHVVDGIFPLDPIPVNRTRVFPTVWPERLGYFLRTQAHAYSNTLVWETDHWTMSGIRETVHFDPSPNSTSYFHNQEVITGFIKDTTWKSRNPTSKRIPKTRTQQDQLGLNRQGEFELFVPTLYAQGGSMSFRSSDGIAWQLMAVGDALWQISITWTDKLVRYLSSCAYVQQSQVQAYAVSEQAVALTAMAKHRDQLLAKCLPGRTYYNLAYQIGELKDLPQTIRGTLSLWRDLEHLIGKAGFKQAMSSKNWWSSKRINQLIPELRKVGVHLDPDKGAADAYLTFKFGWQSMYQAVVALVNRPSQITKDTNFVISRNGKFTTLSAGISYREPVTSFPSVSIVEPPYPTWTYDAGAFGTSAWREVKIRMVVNSGINFPKVDSPRLRQKVWLEKLGLSTRDIGGGVDIPLPTPEDLFNLVPFTWLIDWFAGLGEYVKLMTLINQDRALINWGFMTYASYTHVRSTANIYTTSTVSRTINPPGGQPSWTNKVHWNLSAELGMKYKLRRSLKSLAVVKTYAGTRLSAEQHSILGALLSKFS